MDEAGGSGSRRTACVTRISEQLKTAGNDSRMHSMKKLVSLSGHSNIVLGANPIA